MKPVITIDDMPALELSDHPDMQFRHNLAKQLANHGARIRSLEYRLQRVLNALAEQADRFSRDLEEKR